MLVTLKEICKIADERVTNLRRRFKTAIQNGIKKINKDDDSVQFHDIVMAGKEGMKENVKIAMNTFLMK